MICGCSAHAVAEAADERLRIDHVWQALAAVRTGGRVVVEAGAVVAVWSGVGDAPQRRGTPQADDAAVVLRLVEILADVVILEVAVDPLDGVAAAFRHLAFAFLVLHLV